VAGVGCLYTMPVHYMPYTSYTIMYFHVFIIIMRTQQHHEQSFVLYPLRSQVVSTAVGLRYYQKSEVVQYT